MQKLEQLYEGKAKKVFKTDDPKCTHRQIIRTTPQHSTARKKDRS